MPHRRDRNSAGVSSHSCGQNVHRADVYAQMLSRKYQVPDILFQELSRGDERVCPLVRSVPEGKNR